MYLIVFGVSGRLSTFSSLIEMARNPVEDFGKYGKEDTLSMGTDGSLKREKVVTDVRSKTSLRTCEDWEKATLYFQSVLNAWHPGMVRYTTSMPAAMLKRKIQSGNNPGACLKLLERMWNTWCTSLTRAISVATKSSKHSEHSFYLCDIAFHELHHVKVLEEDYWDKVGEAECRRFKSKVQDERAQAVQDSNAHLAQQIQGLVAQCAALAKAPAGTGRKQ
jgi:hypothetical protein